MNDLIARLEEATGPSYALDCEITESRLPDEWFGSKVESWFGYGSGVYGCNTADGIRHLECLRAGKYTCSIDAALTLVPEGFQAYVDTGIGPGDAHACVWTDYPHRIQGGAREQATPAIALCISALKVRAFNQHHALT